VPSSRFDLSTTGCVARCPSPRPASQHRSRHVGGIGRKPLRLEAEALFCPLDHGLRCTDLGRTNGAGRLDVYAEAKGNGYDVKALRTIVRLRKQDANERAEAETILETYMRALGML
jgi:hypothetical protein